MSDDLTARLERALHAQEDHEATTPVEAPVLADLHARIARGRGVRTTSYAAVAAVVAGVLGVAGWFGLRGVPAPQPAHTPTPVPTSSVTPSPTPTAAAATTAPPVPLVPVSLPGLPSMLEAPEGILEQAGPGWFVVSYFSALLEAPAGDAQRRTLALSAPTGELYHLHDTAERVTPVRWAEPGVVRAIAADDDGRWAATVDLRTGVVTRDERLPDEVAWVGMSGDDELWTSGYGQSATLHVVPREGEVRDVPVPDDRLLLGPDGRQAVTMGAGLTPVQVVDIASGASSHVPIPDGQVCDVSAWLDATGVLATCSDVVPDDRLADPDVRYLDQRHGQVVRLDVTGDTPTVLRVLAGDDVVPWTGHHVQDGTVVMTAAPLLSSAGDCFDFCYGGAYLWTGDDAHAVTTSLDLGDEVCEVGVGGAGLLLRTSSLCYEESTRLQWWTVDPATGETRVVAPAVDSPLSMSAWAAVERTT